MHSWTRTRNRLAGGALVATLLCPVAATADTVSLTPVHDNTLIETPLGNSNGGGDGIFSGRVGLTGSGTRRRALLAFDVSSIPANATVDAVTLTMTVTSTTNPSGQDVALHRVDASWGEGTSIGGGQGAPAQPGEATWTYRATNTDLWTNAGGDFQSTTSASTSVADLGDYTWSGAGMVADVQYWLAHPGSNFGWIAIGNEGTEQTVKKFGSRESFSVPRLVVDYTPSNVGVGSGAPARVSFAPPSPSPATGPVRLTFALPAAGRVSLALLDAQGRLVREFASEQESSAGQHTFVWDGLDGAGATAPAGVYFARLKVANEIFTRRLARLQ